MTKKQYDKDGGNIVITPTNLTVYDYKYNGKEWQDELSLNMYDMDMRQYDPAIARWVVQDPVVHFDYSPYSAFDNNPVFWADPSGADSERDYMGRDRFDSYGRFIAPNDRKDSNEEPPINLFQKSKGSKDKVESGMNIDEIEQVYANLHNEVVESRDYAVGDGIFTVYAHGTYDGAISDRRNGWRNKKLIYSVEELNKVLMEISPEWNKVMSKPENEREQITLYLFACSSGDSKNSIAARFSSIYKNVTVAGFSDKANMGKRIYSDGKTTYGVFGIKNNGSIIYYNNGKHLKSIPFEEYLKTKPLNAIEKQKNDYDKNDCNFIDFFTLYIL